MPEYQDQPKSEQQLAAEKEVAKIDEKSFTELKDQARSEFELSLEFHQTRLDTHQKRLKLYNNQRKDDDVIGDTTLFTVFNTIFASLYDDELRVKFSGREEGDKGQAENFQGMAEYDQEAMEKDVLDYAWIWDTLFFGTGIVYFHEFVRDSKNNIFVPMPESVDPMVFLSDPRAASLSGDARGRGASRFMGREIWSSRGDLESNPDYENLDALKYPVRRTKPNDMMEKAQQARAEAAGFENVLNKEYDLKGDNREYRLIEWLTNWKGKKCLVTLSPDFNNVVRYKEFKRDRFPVIGRQIYPIPHQAAPVSLCDLIEDKQRMLAVLRNLQVKAAKSDLYPTYIFDSAKIKNRADLKFGFNKFIPVDNGLTSETIIPLRKAAVNLGMVDNLMQALDTSAQRATATTATQQGAVEAEKRTATEIAAAAGKTDVRYSLSARLFGLSEKRFWRRYGEIYYDNFKDIDKKVVRINGAFGEVWRELDKKSTIPSIDPDIKIESREVANAARLRQRESFMAYAATVAPEPGANRRYIYRKSGELFDLKTDEIMRILPETPDEIDAKEENEILNDNKLVPIEREDDHPIHLEIHAMAKETDAKMAHIKAHREAVKLQKINPELFPAPTGVMTPEGTPPEAQVAKPRVAPTGTPPITGA